MAIQTERQFIEAVKRAGHVLVTFRKEWTVDGVATSLALGRVLRKMGKKVDVVADGFSAAKSIAFLPGIADVAPKFKKLQKFVIALDIAKTKLDELSYDVAGDKLNIHVTPKEGRFEAKDVTTSASDFKYDLVISVDSPDYGSLGALFSENSEFFYARPTVNVDHDASNEQYGNMNYVDIAATSCAEVVYDLLKASGEHFLDEDVATCLLAGIISKTRSFKTATVTPKALEISSALVAAGGRREEVVQNLYRTRSIATLKLWGRALSRLKFEPVTKTAWALLVRQDFVHSGAGEEHLPDVIDELMMNSPEAEIVGLLYEQEPAGGAAGICALVSTEKHASAMNLVAGLKPDGTRSLARLCFPGMGILEAEKAVLGAIHKSLGKQMKALPVTPPAVNAEAVA